MSEITNNKEKYKMKTMKKFKSLDKIFFRANICKRFGGKLMYYTYMLRCTDNSIYTGMTNNIEKRFKEHIEGTGAKYTKSHKAEKLEAAWRSRDKSLACKLEYQIKQLSKQQKEKIIHGEKLTMYLKGKIDCRRYYRIKGENEQ